MEDDEDRTASLMTPAKLAQVKPKAPVSSSEWLDKMAADAGQPHVHRIAELRADLQVQATKRDFSALAADLERLAQVLAQLDFGLLQQKSGFLARLSGKSKIAVAEFASQFDSIVAASQEVAAQANSLQGRHAEQASRTEMSLVEFEVEFRGLDKIIDQGARWLQDMRAQLKAREAEGGDEAAKRQLREDAQRCELLVARLKSLRALTSAAQQCHQQAQATAARRSKLVQHLHKDVAGNLRDWTKRISPLAEAARQGETTTHSLEGAMDVHRDLQLGIKQAIADCVQAQANEKSLAEQFDSLAPLLQAAG